MLNAQYDVSERTPKTGKLRRKKIDMGDSSEAEKGGQKGTFVRVYFNLYYGVVSNSVVSL